MKSGKNVNNFFNFFFFFYIFQCRKMYWWTFSQVYIFTVFLWAVILIINCWIICTVVVLLKGSHTVTALPWSLDLHLTLKQKCCLKDWIWRDLVLQSQVSKIRVRINNNVCDRKTQRHMWEGISLWLQHRLNAYRARLQFPQVSR